MSHISTDRGSVTLSFEAIILAAMVGAGIVAMTFAEEADCQGQLDAKWVSCTNILNCPKAASTCGSGTLIEDAPPNNQEPVLVF